MPERRGFSSHTRRYPRTARINEVLRQIVAETLEGLNDDRLLLLTITGVETEPDLRHARVFYSARSEGAAEALEEHRVRLQAAIGSQVKMKRTPLLSFTVDAGVVTGWRIEEVLKGLDAPPADDGQ